MNIKIISIAYHLQHLARVILRHSTVDTFKKHPYWVETWAYYVSYGKFPHWIKPITIDEKLLKHSIDLWHAYKKAEIGRETNIELLQEAKNRILCADKYAVRQYVADRCGEGILCKLIGVYQTIDEVDFDTLPNTFVLKMNNASGQNYICKNKQDADIEKMRAQFREWQKDQSHGVMPWEWHYSCIKPKIICEEFLGELEETSLVDYKFHCFNGKVHSCFCCYDRDPIAHKVTYDHYDIEWNHTEAIIPSFRVRQRPIARPECYDQMIVIASKLSADFPYCRVDLYEAKGRVLFGEITLTPSANMQAFYESWMLKKFGDYIEF